MGNKHKPKQWQDEDDFGFADDFPNWNDDQPARPPVHIDVDAADAVDALADLEAAMAEIEAAQADGEEDGDMEYDDDDRIIYQYTDCGGDGDTLTITAVGESLWAKVNESVVVILRDDQVNEIIGSLLKWQDGRDE